MNFNITTKNLRETLLLRCYSTLSSTDNVPFNVATNALTKDRERARYKVLSSLIKINLSPRVY